MLCLLALMTACSDGGAPGGVPPNPGSATAPTDPVATGDYHPPGFDDPDAHGLAAKLQEDTCLSCHGDDLRGGTSHVSCSECHDDGWQTDCTFCHGGTDDSSGAPPRDITGESRTSALSFPPHQSHVEGDLHGGYDCTECHVLQTEAQGQGHFLVGDDSPAVAEVTLVGGLSPDGTWDGADSCANLYCHGDGQRDRGTASLDQDFDACHDCHADSSTRSRWDDMSGEHDEHLEEGVRCSDCHGDTVSNGQSLTGPERHVDGTVDVRLPSDVTRSGGTCSGTCHGESHRSERWEGGGDDD